VIDLMKRRGEPVTDEEARAFREHLVEMGTRQFVYGVLRIERFGSAAPLEPLRLGMSPRATAADFEPFLAWRRLRREPGLAGRLGRARPRLAPGVELAGPVVSGAGHLGGSLRLEAWAVPLVSRMNGAVAVEDLFAAARENAAMPAAVTREDLVELVARLVDRGLLEPGLAE
jgi:hypothetical protein